MHNLDIGLVPLDISSDPFLAAGSPIDGLNLTEHEQINLILEQSKYAHMEIDELIEFSNSTSNIEIQKSIKILIAQKEAMSKLENEIQKVVIYEDIKNINEKQAEEEVNKALKEIPGILGVPAGGDVVEWLNKKTNRTTVAINVTEDIANEKVTEKMKDFVIAMFPKLEKTVERSAIGLSHVGKAKHLYKFYVAVDKAGDHYVDAAEASAYLKASWDIYHKWSKVRTSLHKASAKLYNIIEKEKKNNRNK